MTSPLVLAKTESVLVVPIGFYLAAALGAISSHLAVIRSRLSCWWRVIPVTGHNNKNNRVTLALVRHLPREQRRRFEVSTAAMFVNCPFGTVGIGDT